MLTKLKGHIAMIFYVKVPIPTLAVWGTAPILSFLSSASWLTSAVLFLSPLSCPSVSIFQRCTLDSRFSNLCCSHTEARRSRAPSGIMDVAAWLRGTPVFLECSFLAGTPCPAEGAAVPSSEQPGLWAASWAQQAQPLLLKTGSPVSCRLQTGKSPRQQTM